MAFAVEALSNLASSAASVSLKSTGAAFPPARAQESAATPFSGLLTDAIGQAGKLQDQADAAVTGLMSGSGVDVHTAMIATEKASMAFELSLAVRNKAVQAYQQVMSMQF
jgi:flagellar hook-basal body complex protein FliE